MFGALLLLMTLPSRASLLPPWQTLYDVTFGAGTFVAVGANGTIYSSVSGGAWTLRSSAAANHLRGVAYGGGLFVAAGENGAFSTSPDGVTWTARNITAVLSLPEIAYGNGRFVVGGKGPTGLWTMLVSTNGTNWSSVTVEAPGPVYMPEGLPFKNLTFGAGKFLAVGGAFGTGLSLTSTDGVLWTEHGIDGSPGIPIGPSSFGNGRFGMIFEWYDDDDDDGGGPFQRLMTSDDGLTWNYSTGPAAYAYQAVAAADCKWVIAARSPWAVGTPSAIWVSKGELNWVQLPGITNIINALAFGNGIFVGVGNGIVPLLIPPLGEPFAIAPADLTVSLGNYASFHAGRPCLDPPVRFQWRLNGANIPGATNLSHYFYNAYANQAGDYTIVASNPFISITSAVATLTITLPPPQAPVFSSPTSDTTNLFGIGQDAFLGVAVFGWPPPSFQWHFNGIDLPDATNSYLSIMNVTPEAAGNYTLLARNSMGSVLSPVQTVIVHSGDLAPQYFLSQANFVAKEGSTVSFPGFSPSRWALPPEHFVVLKDGLPSNLPLELHPSSFTLRKVTLADAGTYTVIASNALGAATALVVTLTVTPSTPLDLWTQRNPLPQNESLLKVTYGEGQFIAVGERGAIVSSTNGTNWVSQRLPSELTLNGVVRGGSRFLAMGGRSLLTSSDGAQWNVAFIRADLSLEGIAFANNRFVAVGGDTILSYTDGLGWRDALLTPTAPRWLRDVAFGNGRWVAVGAAPDGGYRPVWTSANGVDWTPVHGMTADLESVIFANGLFLAVGDEGAVFTSADGQTWTSRNSGVSSRLIGAAYGNGRYLAVGTRGRILSSVSGLNWSRETSGTPDRLESVTFGNGLFVAVGENGTTLSSVNGAVWFKRNQASTRDLDGIAIGNGLIAIAGKGGTVLTSSNGSNFVEQTTGVTNDLHGIAWANGLHVAVGEPGAIITSPNGSQWTARTSGSGSSLKGVASSGTRWVAVGTQGQILTSPDGTSWAPSFSGTANDLNSVAHGKGLFVAVGDNLPPNGTLLTSPDGLSWTRRPQFIGKNLRSVTFANNMFLATGNDGIILLSSNGTHWTQPFPWPFVFNNLRAATFADGVWVVTGNYGLIMTSTDAINWIQHPAQTRENLHGVVSLGRRFVTIGNRGIVLQSSYRAQPAHLSGRVTAAGFQVFLDGEAGASYQLQAADRLPAPSWTTLGTFLLTNPSTNLVDTTATNLSQRYYRAISP